MEEYKKSADEMFEKLGFRKIVSRNSWNITYKSTRDLAQIIFWTTDKEVCCSNDEDEAIHLSMQELQAINEKCKELGWIV